MRAIGNPHRARVGSDRGVALGGGVGLPGGNVGLGGRFGLLLAALVALLIAGCATPPSIAHYDRLSRPTETAPSAIHLYQFDYEVAGGRRYRVTVLDLPLERVRLVPLHAGVSYTAVNPRDVATAWLAGTPGAGTSGEGTSGAGTPAAARVAAVATTPFEPDGTPAGIVLIEGATVAPPREPYWALAWESAAAGVRPVPQAAWAGGVLAEALLPNAIGVFYPVVLEGAVVAQAFPGRTLRAARVAVGLKRGKGPEGAGDPSAVDSTATFSDADARLIITAVDGGLWPRRGLTTVELGALMVELGCDFALNLDGGRSAFVMARQPLFGTAPADRPDGASPDRPIADPIVVRPAVPLGVRRLGPVLIGIELVDPPRARFEAASGRATIENQ